MIVSLFWFFISFSFFWPTWQKFHLNSHFVWVNFAQFQDHRIIYGQGRDHFLIQRFYICQKNFTSLNSFVYHENRLSYPYLNFILLHIVSLGHQLLVKIKLLDIARTLIYMGSSSWNHLAITSTYVCLEYIMFLYSTQCDDENAMPSQL